MQPTLKNLHTLESKYETKLQEYVQAIDELEELSSSMSLNNEKRLLLTQFIDASRSVMNKKRRGRRMRAKALVRKLRASDGAFVVKKDRVFWGSRALKTMTTNGENACLDKCKSKRKCTGATYVPSGDSGSVGVCMLRAGRGNIKTKPGKYAIVNAFEQAVRAVKEYQSQLMDINSDLIAEITETKGNDLGLWNDKTDEMEENVTTNHNDLVDQRSILDDLMTNYDVMSIQSEETGYNTRQFMLQYRLWIVILMIVLFIIPYVWVFGTPPALISLLFFIFVLWLFEVKYLAMFALVIYILYYIYMIPLD